MIKETEELRKIHDEALSEFDKVQKALRDERLQCLQDRRFVSLAGAQWEGPLGLQFENKPKLEINKVHLAMIRIENEYRNNRISVSFIPKDGTTGASLGDTCKGLYRADEQDSTADEARDNGFQEGIGGGFGAWRLRADKEDENDDDDDAPQRIYIEPIFDADSSVFFDIDAKRQDKRDARKCWVLSSLSRAAYEEEYGDDVSSWPKVTYQRQFDWHTPDVIYLAEYYKKIQVPYTLLNFEGPAGLKKVLDEEEYKEDSDLRKQLRDTGFVKRGEKLKKRTKVRKYLINGQRVIEDNGIIAGCNIPIIPYYGKRWFIDNVERCMGHVRLAKDAQRIKNMQMSKLAEIAALSSVEKPIFTPEQMGQHGTMWTEDNLKNYPYLLLNPMTDADGQVIANGPIAYTKAPNIPPAMAALLQLVEQDIKDILGNQEAGEEVQSNISGVAVELIHNKLDMQTFIYISNFAKSMKREGEVWLSMAKEVYVENERKRKVVNDAGETSSVVLNQLNIDEGTGTPKVVNDLSEADFDVSAIPGPTSESKRASTVRSLIGLLGVTQDPETVQILTAIILTNIEGEGIEEVREYFHNKLVKMGVIKPTAEEQQVMAQAAAAAQQQQPDANTQFLLASAEQAKADAMKKQADTVKVTADAEKSRAETMKILNDIQAGNVEQAMAKIEALQNAALGYHSSQLAADTTAANVAHKQAQTLHTHAQIANTQAQTDAINNPPETAAT
jgi:hypothetical protein